jgi:histo-blood group ABO system transferase
LAHVIGSVGVVSVATNRYVHYWMEMAASADVLLFPGTELTLHVFTDQPELVEAFAPRLSRIRVNPIRIQALTWPAATMQRFQLISDHADQLTEQVLVHLDADMVVVAATPSNMDPQAWIGGMALVRHPGYRRPRGSGRLKFYLRHPMRMGRDLARFAKEGALGTWERNPASTAYVPRGKRRAYVCGATWMGLRESFIASCALLAANTAQDDGNGLIALWHDESHMNWFAANRPRSLLDSEYCFVEGSANLADLKPLIVAVEKSDERTR